MFKHDPLYNMKKIKAESCSNGMTTQAEHTYYLRNLGTRTLKAMKMIIFYGSQLCYVKVPNSFGAYSPFPHLTQAQNWSHKCLF